MKRSREDSDDDEDADPWQETKKKAKSGKDDALRIGVFTYWKSNCRDIQDQFKTQKEQFKAMTGIDMTRQTYEFVCVPISTPDENEKWLDAFKEMVLAGPGAKVDVIMVELIFGGDPFGFDQLDILRLNPELVPAVKSPDDMINELRKSRTKEELMITYICTMLPAWKDRVVIYQAVKQYPPKNFQIDEKTKTVNVASPIRQVTDSISVPVYAAHVFDSPPNRSRYSARDMKLLTENKLALVKNVVVAGQKGFEFRYSGKATDAIKLASVKNVLTWLYEWHPQTKRQTKLAMKDAFNYDERLKGSRRNPKTGKDESVSNMPEAIEDEIASYLGKLKLSSDTPPKKKKKTKQKLLLVDSSSDSD